MVLTGEHLVATTPIIETDVTQSKVKDRVSLLLACVSAVLFCIELEYRRWHSILLFSVVLCFVIVL